MGNIQRLVCPRQVARFILSQHREERWVGTGVISFSSVAHFPDNNGTRVDTKVKNTEQGCFRALPKT